MGFFSEMMGNASEIDIDEIREDYAKFLASGERIEHAYRLIRDLFIFTDKRLIFVDVQGLTGKKTEYLSIPYKSITHFSIETAGHFDLDAELKIWISGMGTEPLCKRFNKSLNIYALQQLLAQYILI